MQRVKGPFTVSRSFLSASKDSSLENSDIAGEVVGGPNQVPVKNVKVIFRKKVVDKTNEEGKFSFTVTDDVDRLAVTFQDPADEFSDTTQTMPFQSGRTVVHRVVLQREDPPVTFDSSEDLRVPLGHAGDNMAELELPADSLLEKDGKPFKGEVQPYAYFEKTGLFFRCSLHFA